MNPSKIHYLCVWQLQAEKIEEFWIRWKSLNEYWLCWLLRVLMSKWDFGSAHSISGIGLGKLFADIYNKILPDLWHSTCCICMRSMLGPGSCSSSLSRSQSRSRPPEQCRTSPTSGPPWASHTFLYAMMLPRTHMNPLNSFTQVFIIICVCSCNVPYVHFCCFHHICQTI